MSGMDFARIKNWLADQGHGHGQQRLIDVCGIDKRVHDSQRVACAH